MISQLNSLDNNIGAFRPIDSTSGGGGGGECCPLSADSTSGGGGGGGGGGGAVRVRAKRKVFGQKRGL